MGSTDRRAREKAATREAMLRAAIEIAEDQGWDAVTVRAIAARVEYSPSNLYEHFTSKSDILSNIARDALAILSRRLGEAAPDPDEIELEALCQVIWEWSFENPKLFDLINVGDIFEFGTEATPSEAQEIFATMRRSVVHVIPTASDDLASDLTDILWASLTGLILLAMSNRIAGGKARADRLFREMLVDFRRAWPQRLQSDGRHQ